MANLLTKLPKVPVQQVSGSSRSLGSRSQEIIKARLKQFKPGEILKAYTRDSNEEHSQGRSVQNAKDRSLSAKLDADSKTKSQTQPYAQ